MLAGMVTVLSSACLLLGAFLIISGAVGVLRFPDFFTRMHAAGVTETLATTLILLGLMLFAGWTIVSFKLLLILLFILITSPVASHALTKAALHGNLQPLVNENNSCGTPNWWRWAQSISPVRYPGGTPEGIMLMTKGVLPSN